MGKYAKLLQEILSGASDSGIGFTELCVLLHRLGFEERIRGDHHIFTKSALDEILNLQPTGRHAKNYQVKQVRNVLLKYRMGDTDVD